MYLSFWEDRRKIEIEYTYSQLLERNKGKKGEKINPEKTRKKKEET